MSAPREIAKTIGAEQITFDEAARLRAAPSALIRAAIDNFKNRDPTQGAHPQGVAGPLVAGFTNEAINYMLGGRFRSTFRPLNDAIIHGRIQGVVGIVGCSNPKVKTDDSHVNA